MGGDSLRTKVHAHVWPNARLTLTFMELTPAHLLLLAVGIGCAVVGRAVINLIRSGRHHEDNKTILTDTRVALAKDTRRLALVWAEKRTPTRPRVQVFDTPPGPHVRTNHLGHDLVCGRKLPVGVLCSAAPHEHQLVVLVDRVTSILDDVDAEWTASDIRAATTAKTGRAVDDCFVISGGKRMNDKDGTTLAQHGVGKGRQVELRRRKKGAGCGNSKVQPSIDDDECSTAASKALEAAVKAFGIAPGPPEAQALALAQKGLWPETWDGGETWHEEGNKEKALPAALVEAELAAKAAVEAQNLEKFGTTAPNSDKAAKFSHALSFPIWFIVQFTDKHKCWNWKTSRVVRDIIKPMTAMTRCRFAELPEFRDIVGAAQARRRPLSPLLPPPPCNAHRRFRPPNRSRSDRTAGAPSGGCSWRRSRTGPTPTAGSGSTCAAR